MMEQQISFIKIDGEFFYVKDCSIQLKTHFQPTGSYPHSTQRFPMGADMEFRFDAAAHPEYMEYFHNKMYSQRSGYVKDYKFTLENESFAAYGAFITSLECDTSNNISVSMNCDYFTTMTLSERRDFKIDTILNR